MKHEYSLEESLIVRMMWIFALRPIEVSFITFDDFEKGDGMSYQLKLYRSKKHRFQFFSTSDQELIEDIKAYKVFMQNNALYIHEIRHTSTNKTKSGYFLFKRGEKYLHYLFSTKFCKILNKPEKWLLPKDIRRSVISYTSSKYGIQAAATLADHKSVTTTRENYDRSSNNLKKELK